MMQRTQTNKLKPTPANDKDGLKFFYDYIMKLGLDESSEEYIDEVSLFVGASFETTSESLAGTLLLLGMNPDKQDILYSELSSVMSSPDDYVSEEILDNLPYLGLVIKESLRLLPAAIASCLMKLLKSPLNDDYLYCRHSAEL